MAINTIPALRTALQGFETGIIDRAQFIPRLLEIIDSVGTVGGGLISARTVAAADPTAQTLGTTPIKLTGAWTANMESRGMTSDFTTGRVTVAAGGNGSFDVDYSCSMKGTSGRRYLLGIRVSRGGAETFENDLRAESTIGSSTEVKCLTGTGRITNLASGDWVELWGMADAASSTFVMRQAQLKLLRVA